MAVPANTPRVCPVCGSGSLREHCPDAPGAVCAWETCTECSTNIDWIKGRWTSTKGAK